MNAYKLLKLASHFTHVGCPFLAAKSLKFRSKVPQCVRGHLASFAWAGVRVGLASVEGAVVPEHRSVFGTALPVHELRVVAVRGEATVDLRGLDLSDGRGRVGGGSQRVRVVTDARELHLVLAPVSPQHRLDLSIEEAEDGGHQ